MVNIKSISTGLEQGKDGIWYSTNIEPISYPSDGNDACLAIEDNSFWFKHRNNCITSIVKAYPPKDNGTIFDIGGGNGFVSSELMDKGFEIALVEPGISGALQARRRGVENVICATTNTAEFKENSLPAVGLFDVIEHIEDDFYFLKSIKNLMKIDGYLYITVPSYQFLWSEDDISAGHYRRYSLEEISEVLEKVGFEVKFSSYIFRFLPLPIFILRTLIYKLGFSNNEKSAMKTSQEHIVKGGFKGRILNFFLKPEINNLKNNKRMRFGGSCLIVAKCV